MQAPSGECADYDSPTASKNGHGYLSPRSMERDERIRHFECTQPIDQIRAIGWIQHIRRVQKFK